MAENVKIESGVHEGGEVDPESNYTMPVGDQHLPWHQGRKAEWKKDNYCEYVKIGEDFSIVDERAHRVKVRFETEFTNERRYNDWKGYDEIDPRAHTKLFFNDMQVASVHAWPSDILRHMLAVNDKIRSLFEVPVMNRWSREEIENLVGMQVNYDGYPGIVLRIDQMYAGEIMVYCPTWPDDGYDRNGMLLTPIDYEKLEWRPNMADRITVTPDTPYTGPAYIEEDGL